MLDEDDERRTCAFDDLWNEGWTPRWLTLGKANIYAQIATPLKGGAWRLPGLVKVATELAKGGGPRERWAASPPEPGYAPDENAQPVAGKRQRLSVLANRLFAQGRPSRGSTRASASARAADPPAARRATATAPATAPAAAPAAAQHVLEVEVSVAPEDEPHGDGEARLRAVHDELRVPRAIKEPPLLDPPPLPPGQAPQLFRAPSRSPGWQRRAALPDGWPPSVDRPDLRWLQRQEQNEQDLL